MTAKMKRREFITLLGGTAFMLPLAARTAGRADAENRRAHQHRRGRAGLARQALPQLGWSDGGNVRIEARVAKGNPERLHSDSA